MSIVVDVFEAALDLAGDVVEAVGDGVAYVADVVVDTIEYVVENPVEVLVTVGAASVGIPPPVTAAAVTAAKGGDLEDIGKAALGAYAGQQVSTSVGRYTSNALQGSSLQNALSSAAASGAGGATQAAITGGDVAKSFAVGAVGGAGASLARDVGTAAQYGTDPLSEQTRMLTAQDVGINPFTGLAADIGSVAGRAVVSGDLAGELQSAVLSGVTRTVADELRAAYDRGIATEESQRAMDALAEEYDKNPAFAEQIQLAQIAKGDEILTVGEQMDALAEAMAREEFEKASTGEQLAALPAIAIPAAGNVLRQTAQIAAPMIVRRISQFAANDPRFAQVVVTNNYVQQVLTAAGLAATVAQNGDVIIETLTRANESPAETARLLRYATEVQKQVPQVKPEQIQQLERETRVADLVAQRDELNQLGRQGYNVARELERVNIEIQRQIPLIDVTVPDVRAAEAPQTEIEPTLDVDIRPVPREEPAAEPRPEEAPAAEPRPEEALEPARQPEPAPETAPRPVQRLEPAARTPTRGTQPRLTFEPVEIEQLFSDEDILRAIEEQFATTPTAEGEAVGGGEFEVGTAEGAIPTTGDVRPGVVGQQRPLSLSPRQVGQGVGSITGRKEPVFGGDPGAQQDVWNIRSLRLKRALGL